MTSNDNQWHLPKLCCEIFLWYNYPCYVNDIPRNKVVRYFYGTSDTSNTSNTANSSDASKTSASVTRVSSYFLPILSPALQLLLLLPVENKWYFLFPFWKKNKEEILSEDWVLSGGVVWSVGSSVYLGRGAIKCWSIIYTLSCHSAK